MKVIYKEDIGLFKKGDKVKVCDVKATPTGIFYQILEVSSDGFKKVWYPKSIFNDCHGYK